MNQNYILACSIIAVMLLFGCSSFNTEEAVPSYINIKNYSLSSNGNQGSIHHNFQDAWMYVNGDYAGAYQIPFNIPVLSTGNSTIRITPGIRVNGSQTEARIYPFIKAYETSQLLAPGLSTLINPIYEYESDVFFPLNEDFDFTHFFTKDIDGDLETKMVLSASADSYEGANSGIIRVDSIHQNYIGGYEKSINIPVTPNRVYIELHFKSTVNFYVGLYGIIPGSTPVDLVVARLNPKTEWTKVYFDFTELTNSSGATSYQPVIQLQYDKEKPEIDQVVQIDNLKIIYR
ncbi:MAG: hypothetical protein IPQ10_11365 [Saprospiraceae bacterium]|jgi:hypothetical protein|nr:hypothetical protein [Saprospiraceae bacterium]MBK7797267.1 hypothetical protein [Saprospiraceae bacterium]MBK9377753.1 hypothetical protein [Saprospiraceae bacterium]MBL0261638.1 hypothetical protein [Saprospiraceae bacterium]